MGIENKASGQCLAYYLLRLITPHGDRKPSTGAVRGPTSLPLMGIENTVSIRENDAAHASLPLMGIENLC